MRDRERTVTVPEVLFESEDYLVLDKPSGLIAHSDGRTQEPSVAAWLIERYPALLGIGEPWISPQGERIPVGGLVHRLDRTTSGILLAARTKEMHEYLKNQIKARRIEKKYLAYVYGTMEKESGRIVAEIVRSSTRPKRWYAKESGEDDLRSAVTDWRLRKTLKGASYVEIYPRTGRTHQIRVHFAHIGHPLVADHLYAPDLPALFGFTRPALHASSLSFMLPTGEYVTFESPLPPDFP
jgi:23S rRNA pseudouridine1911/1915/1917 synthase